MGFFDFFFGKAAVPPLAHDELRERIVAAVANGDTKQLARLARDYREQIATSFPEWKRLPEAIRKDQAAAQRYMLELQRYNEAVDWLTETETLAPGWFHCRADCWLAERLASGLFDHVVFRAVVGLEDASDSAQSKLEVAEALLSQFPILAVAHLHRARNLAALGRSTDAELALRQGLSCDSDIDVRTRLLTDLGSMLLHRNTPEAIDLLRQAVELNGNLVAAVGAKLALRRS